MAVPPSLKRWTKIAKGVVCRKKKLYRRLKHRNFLFLLILRSNYLCLELCKHLSLFTLDIVLSFLSLNFVLLTTDSWFMLKVCSFRWHFYANCIETVELVSHMSLAGVFISSLILEAIPFHAAFIAPRLQFNKANYGLWLTWAGVAPGKLGS